MTTRGLLIVLSAPSGAGKTTICRRLLERDRRLARSVSVTTRAPRGGERRGRDYHFVDEASFERRVRAGDFLEWAEVHGARYGTPKADVEAKRRRGKDVILVIDVQGGLSVKQQRADAVLVFVKPPNFAVLANRLALRGTDSRGTIQRRLRHARWELALAGRYDYHVVNRRLQDAVEHVRAIITAERLRVRDSIRSGSRSVPRRRIREA